MQVLPFLLLLKIALSINADSFATNERGRVYHTASVISSNMRRALDKSPKSESELPVAISENVGTQDDHGTTASQKAKKDETESESENVVGGNVSKKNEKGGDETVSGGSLPVQEPGTADGSKTPAPTTLPLEQGPPKKNDKGAVGESGLPDDTAVVISDSPSTIPSDAPSMVPSIAPSQRNLIKKNEKGLIEEPVLPDPKLSEPSDAPSAVPTVSFNLVISDPPSAVPSVSLPSENRRALYEAGTGGDQAAGPSFHLSMAVFAFAALALVGFGFATRRMRTIDPNTTNEYLLSPQNEEASRSFAFA